MKKLLSLLLAAVLSMPVMASASEIGVYVEPKIGGAYQDFRVSVDGDHYDGDNGSFGGGLAVGYDFNTKFEVPLRVELEYTAWTSDESTETETFSEASYGLNLSDKYGLEVGVQSLFANMYYDFHNSTRFTPYIGAGLGMGFLKSTGTFNSTLDINLPSYSKSYTLYDDKAVQHDTVFAWNAGLGCSFALNDNFAVDLSYRYVYFCDVDYGEGVELDRNDMHQFMFGLRYTF